MTKSTSTPSRSTGKNASAPVKNPTTAATATNENAAPAPVVVRANTAPAAPESIGLVGTPEQLIARRIHLNGKPMAATDFANLKKFHFKTVISVDDYVPKAPGVKGKSTEIVKLTSDVQGFAFSFPA
jgi:hypothetical protein